MPEQSNIDTRPTLLIEPGTSSANFLAKLESAIYADPLSYRIAAAHALPLMNADINDPTVSPDIPLVRVASLFGRRPSPDGRRYKPYDYDATFDPATEAAIAADPKQQADMRKARQRVAQLRSSTNRGPIVQGGGEEERDSMRLRRLTIFVTRVMSWQRQQDETINPQDLRSIATAS